MKNAPKKIWLNVGDVFPDDDFNELSGVTWCEDKIGENDIPYRLVRPLQTVLKEWVRENIVKWINKTWKKTKQFL